MKKLLNVFIAVSMLGILFAGCQKESSGVDDTNYGPLKVTKVYQHNVKAIKELDPEEGARLGTMIRLEGENFMGIRAITVNGSPASLNPNLRTENSIIFRIPSTNSTTNEDTPTGSDCEEAYRDKIIITSNGNADYEYYFHVMGSLPTVSGLDHTLPSIGSWVTVSGSNLKDVQSVDIYNDLNEVVATTDQIRNEDPKGKSVEFKMPEVVLWSEISGGDFAGCYEGGYIVVNTGNGSAASPNYFYRQKNIFLNNFYSQSDSEWGMDLYTYNPSATNSSYYAWGSGTSGNLPDSENYPDFDADIAYMALSDGPQAPDMFRALPLWATKIPVCELSDGEHSADGGACIARACFNSDACTGRALGMAQNMASGVALFSGATGTDKLAFQFDFCIAAPWNSGRIAVTFVDNGVKWMAHYHPWTTNPEHYAQGMEHWETATIPLSDFENFMDQTYSYLLKNTIKGVNGDYACQGMIAFYNDECDGMAAREIAAEENFVVYFQNLRIVPMMTPEQILDDNENPIGWGGIY